MADQRIDALSPVSTPADGDKLYIIDVSDTTESGGTSKYITYQSLTSGLGGGLTWDSSTTTASHTATVGSVHRYAVGSSDIKVTFPSSPSVGDSFAMFIDSETTSQGSFYAAPGYGVEPATGTVINGVTTTQAPTGFGVRAYGIMLDGEHIEFTYAGSTRGWIVSKDARIPMNYFDELTDSATAISHSGGDYTVQLYNGNALGKGDLAHQTNDIIQIKRNGLYRFAFNARGTPSYSNYGDTLSARILYSTATYVRSYGHDTVGGEMGAFVELLIDASNNYAQGWKFIANMSGGSLRWHVSVQEVLRGYSG